MSFAKIRPLKTVLAVCALGAIGITVWRSPLYGAESPVVIAPPVIDTPRIAGAPQTAVLAGAASGGCRVSSSTYGV
jgi:hypothetical protein